MTMMTTASKASTKKAAMINSEIAATAGHGARIVGAHGSQWVQHNFRAMNTAVYALCFGADAATVAAVETLFRRQEAALSRFDPASDLSALNGSSSETCAVSSDLYAALEVALWAAQGHGRSLRPEPAACARRRRLRPELRTVGGAGGIHLGGT